MHRLSRTSRHVLIALIGTILVFTPYLLIIFKAPSIWYFYPWLDIPFHIAGGMVVGVWVYAVLCRRHNTKPLRERATLFFFSVLTVGIAWEVFEFILDITARTRWLGNWFDTIGDILNALIGGLLIWFIIRKRD